MCRHLPANFDHTHTCYVGPRVQVRFLFVCVSVFVYVSFARCEIYDYFLTYGAIYEPTPKKGRREELLKAWPVFLPHIVLATDTW